jgi:ATP-dependent Clp protease ATP-binding subunit ClpC
VLLIGPTGVGKTTTVEALPAALRALGYEGARVFRIDCGELTDSIQLTRILGAPPGYSGHADTTPLITTLERPGCILLVDELEKAHPDVLDLLLGLLDAGRLRNPAGHAVKARHIVIALTTSMASDDLTLRLGRIPLEDRWAIQRTCADHLRASGIPSDLVGRIGAFAVFADVDGEDDRLGIAQAAVTSLGREYGLVVDHTDPVVLEVIRDIAGGDDSSGVRPLHHAARELLAGEFAELAADGPPLHVTIAAGPPLEVRVVGRAPSEA